MASKKSKNDEPEFDPYDVLGIEQGSSDAMISKAYRKLALRLHPDKQTNKTPQEAEEIAKQFHNVKEARSFLLDLEHREARIKYDAKRASIQRRRKADAQRELGMNERRKRMRDELKRQEEEALASKKRAKSLKSKRSKHEDELLDKLRKEGNSMRQAFAEKEAEASAAAARKRAKEDQQDQKQQERLLQDRQIRLKWSRKKMKTSPSEHSLATLLSRFGSVESVEMLGSKGNLALVTFAYRSSCTPCVEAYKTSDEMRASYVGKRKEEEEARQAAAEQELGVPMTLSNASQDEESLYDRKLRQAAEREKLMREMEAEDAEDSEVERSGSSQAQLKQGVSTSRLSSRSVSAQFPSTEAYRNLGPIQKLQKAEGQILEGLMNPAAYARLKVLHSSVSY